MDARQSSSREFFIAGVNSAYHMGVFVYKNFEKTSHVPVCAFYLGNQVDGELTFGGAGRIARESCVHELVSSAASCRLHADIPPTFLHAGLIAGACGSSNACMRSARHRPLQALAEARTLVGRLHADIPPTLHEAHRTYVRIIRLHVTHATPRGNGRLHYLRMPLTCQPLLALAEARTLA